MKIEQENYWGPWATLGFGVLILAVFSFLQTIILIVYGLYLENWVMPENTEEFLASLIFNGNAISMAEIPAALFGVLTVLFLTSLRKPLTITNYLDLNSVSIPTLLKWLGIMVAAIVSIEALNNILGRETPEFMSKVYESTTNMPLLWFAVIIAAPFFEEFLFRGFLLEGLRRSALGTAGAIIIISAIWAVIHAQYEAFEVVTIFLIGIVLAIAKLKTNSLYVPIAMHLLMNLTASVFMAFATVD